MLASSSRQDIVKSIRERRRLFTRILSSLASFVTLSLRPIFASSAWGHVNQPFELGNKPYIKYKFALKGEQDCFKWPGDYHKENVWHTLTSRTLLYSVESKMKKKKKVVEGENTSVIGCWPKNAGKSSCNTVRRHETHVTFCGKRSTVILNSATEKNSVPVMNPAFYLIPSILKSNS